MGLKAIRSAVCERRTRDLEQTKARSSSFLHTGQRQLRIAPTTATAAAREDAREHQVGPHGSAQNALAAQQFDNFGLGVGLDDDVAAITRP
jgi:hypothetical protein